MSKQKSQENGKVPTVFTPLFEELGRYYGPTDALVFGRIWRYCQQNGYCTAAHGTIAKELGISRSTVIRAVSIFTQEGLLVDKTPTVRYRPHTYTVNNRKVQVVVKGWQSMAAE